MELKLNMPIREKYTPFLGNDKINSIGGRDAFLYLWEVWKYKMTQNKTLYEKRELSILITGFEKETIEVEDVRQTLKEVLEEIADLRVTWKRANIIKLIKCKFGKELCEWELKKI